METERISYRNIVILERAFTSLSFEERNVFFSTEVVIIFLKDPGTPWGLSTSNVGTARVSLEWKEPELTTREGISYRVS